MLHKDSKRDSVFQRRSLLDFDCPQPFNVEIGAPEMADEQVQLHGALADVPYPPPKPADPFGEEIEYPVQHGVLGGGMKRR